MSLLDRPVIGEHEPTTRPTPRATRLSVERRWRGPSGRPPRPSRSVLVALLLACATLVTLDYHGGPDSPLEPARQAVGEVLGPVQSAVDTVVGPLVAVPGALRRNASLREEVARLEAESARLRQTVAASDFGRNRLAEYDGLTTAAEQAGYALVPARVVAMGPGQSFSRTVTIDAGSRAGVEPDMTVVSNDGLVGRVLRVTSTTATVLLVVDGDSVVGGRLGASLEAGYLRGRGVLGDDARLDMELVDDTVVPARDDVVVTWGSEDGAPYVAGIPVGRVTDVYANVRDQTQRVVVEPFTDFSALDVVGVVVPSGTTSDRAVVEADGSLQ